MEEKIEKVLETIKPYLMSDGGNIEFIKYENKTVLSLLLLVFLQASFIKDLEWFGE